MEEGGKQKEREKNGREKSVVTDTETQIKLLAVPGADRFAVNNKINTRYRSTRAKHRIWPGYKLHRERYSPANTVGIIQYPWMKVANWYGS